MIISGLNKTIDLSDLEKIKSVKHLEIQNFSLKDDWSVVKKFSNLESLIVKDSHIDFKKFYSSICFLNKLNKLTYNHYCYFNKSKKDKFKKSQKLESLKTFRLEFPKSSDPDFEINNWSQKSHENKFNSITDVPNSYNFFPNIENIEFQNYQTYKERILDYDENNKKVLKEIYWNMDAKTLNNFRSLNTIKIDDGKISDAINIGIFSNKNPELKKSKIKFNGIQISDYQIIYNQIKTLSISSKNDRDVKLKTKINKIDEDIFEVVDKFIEDDLCIQIQELNLYTTKYGWRKPWRINKKLDILINDYFENIIFENVLDFCSLRVYGIETAQKKIDLFINFLKKQKNLKLITLNIPKINDENTEQDIIVLKQFVYQLSKEFQNTNIFINIRDLNKIITSKENIFKLYLLYLTNFLIEDNLINNKVFFLGIENKTLIKFHNENIFKNIDSVIIIDDIFFNTSKKFKDIDFILSSQIINENLISHYPELLKNLDSVRNPKKSENISPFQSIYEEVTRIISFQDSRFKIDNRKLILLVRKNKFSKLNGINFKKFFSYLGNNKHLIGHKKSDKKYKIDKIYEINEKNLEKLRKASKQIVDDIINSGEFQTNGKIKKDFEQTSGEIKVIDDLDYFGISKDQVSELTHLWFEGVRPWMGKYIILKDLNKLFNTNNLEYLRLGDCIAFDDYQLPKIETLKYLKLDFSVNEHRKIIDTDIKSKLNSFYNLPNLESIDITGLYANYPDNLSKTQGFNISVSDRWGSINVDFKDIHNLSKLKKIIINDIEGSNLKSIKYLPAVEHLILKCFNISKDMNPDEDKYIENGVVDEDFKFLISSKKLVDFTLVIGDIPTKEDLYGNFLSSYYRGNADFINFINHNIKTLKLNINLNINNQFSLQDFINNICNRFLKLEFLELKFGFAIDEKSFSYEKGEYNKKIKSQILDFKKFVKLKNLINLKLYSYDSYMNYKTINFSEIIKLKKIKEIQWHYETIDFEELRKTRQIFKNEKYDNPKYYDEDYDYYDEEDSTYKENWSRFHHINSVDGEYDFISLESVYIDREKEENKKKYKKKVVIKKKSN